jgi:hypothetical protein
MTSPYRAMCAELVDALENARRIIDGADGTLHINTAEFVLRRARALLAQPEPEGPTIMEIIELHTWMEDEWRANNDGEDLPMVDYARAVLAKWGTLTPQPVAVSERLPGPEDCDAEGRCWWEFEGSDDYEPCWTLGKMYGIAFDTTHWLPANALPTPEDTNDC